MKRISKRILAVLLAVAMVVPNVGMTTFAAEPNVIMQEGEATPTPEITPSPEIKETPAVEEPSEEPEESPEVTPEPVATEVPDETPVPENTPEPQSTQEPVATQEPEASSTPEVSASPEMTATPIPSVTPTPGAAATPSAVPFAREMYNASMYQAGTATITGSSSTGVYAPGARLSLSYGNLAITSCSWFAAAAGATGYSDDDIQILEEGLTFKVTDDQLGKWIYAVYTLDNDPNVYATAFYGPILDPRPVIAATEGCANTSAIRDYSIMAPSKIQKRSNGDLLYKYDVLTNELTTEPGQTETYVDLTIEACGIMIPGSFENLSDNHTNTLDEQVYGVDERHVRVHLNMKDGMALVKYAIGHSNFGTQDVYVLITAADASKGVWAVDTSIWDAATNGSKVIHKTQSVWDGTYTYAIVPYVAENVTGANLGRLSNYEYCFLVQNGQPYKNDFSFQYSEGAEDSFEIQYSSMKLTGFSDTVKRISITKKATLETDKSITIVPQAEDGDPIVLTWTPDMNQLLFYTSVEDIGDTSKAVNDINLRVGQVKTIYITSQPSGQALTQNSCDTLAFSGEKENEVIEAFNIINSKSFHNQNDTVPAYIEIELDGTKIFSTPGSNRILNLYTEGLYGSLSCMGGQSTAIMMCVGGTTSEAYFIGKQCSFRDTQIILNKKTNFSFYNLNENEIITTVSTGQAGYYGDNLIKNLYQATILPGGTAIDIKILYSGCDLAFQATTSEGRVLNFSVRTTEWPDYLQDENGKYISGVYSPFSTQNTDYRNQVRTEKLQLMFGEWIYNNQTQYGYFSPHEEVNEYIESIKFTINSQSIAEGSGTALGAGADKVIWLGDGSSNTVMLQKDATGRYATDINLGYNFGVVFTTAFVQFKSTEDVPDAFRGKKYTMRNTFFIEDEAGDVNTMSEPKYFLDTEGATTQQQEENFQMLQQYINYKASTVTGANEQVTINLPENVTFRAINSANNEPLYLELDTRIKLAGASSTTTRFTEGGIKVSLALNCDQLTACEISNISFSSAQASDIDVISGAGAVFVVNCDFNFDAGAPATYINAVDGPKQVRECQFTIAGTCDLMKIADVYAAESCFVYNSVTIKGAGSRLFNLVSKGTDPLLFRKFIVDSNGLNAESAACELTQADKAGNLYMAGNTFLPNVTQFTNASDTIGYEAESYSGECVPNFAYSQTNAIRLFVPFSNAVIAKTNYPVSSAVLSSQANANEAGEKIAFQIGNVDELLPAYEIGFVLEDKAVDAFVTSQFTPYGQVSNTNAAIEKLLTKGFSDYQVIALDQQGVFPAQATITMPIDTKKFTGPYYPTFIYEGGKLKATGNYATVDEKGNVNFEVTEGGTYVVASYATPNAFAFGLNENGKAEAYVLTASGDSGVKEKDIYLVLNPAAPLDTVSGNSIVTNEPIITGVANSNPEDLRSALSAADFEKVQVSIANTTKNKENLNWKPVVSKTEYPGVIKVTIPRGQYGDAVITATMTNGKVVSKTTATLKCAYVAFDLGKDITKQIQPDSKYNKATVTVYSSEAAPIKSIYATENDKLEITGWTTGSVAGGKTANITFNVKGNETTSITLELSAGKNEICVPVQKIFVDTEGLGRYLIISPEGEAPYAILTGTLPGNSCSVLDEISIDNEQIPVLAIAGGAFNQSVSENGLVGMGVRTVIIGKNVKKVGVIEHLYGSIRNDGWYATPQYLCAPDSKYGCLEEIYVDPNNAFFTGNNPNVGDEECDYRMDYNLYEKITSGDDDSPTGKIALMEYPTFSKRTQWEMPENMSSFSREYSSLATNDYLETIVIGKSFEKSYALAEHGFPMNTKNLKAFRSFGHEGEEIENENGFSVQDEVLYWTYSDSYSENQEKYLAAYPTAKQADAILLQPELSGVFAKALQNTLINTLVISPGTCQNNVFWISTDKPFVTNAKNIYFYNTDENGKALYDIANMDNIITAPAKGVTVYATADSGYKTWATQKKYAFKEIKTNASTEFGDNWEIAGKNPIKTSTLADGTSIQYMYMNMGDFFTVGSLTSGIGIKSKNANDFGAMYPGQISYSFNNNYNTTHEDTASIFGQENSEPIENGEHLTANSPGVACMDIVIDGEVKASVYLVVRLPGMSIPKEDTQTLGAGNHTLPVLIDGENIEGGYVGSYLAAYYDLGLYSWEPKDADIIKPATYNDEGIERTINNYGSPIYTIPAATATKQVITTQLLDTTYTTNVTIYPIDKEAALSLDNADGAIVNNTISKPAYAESGALLEVTYGENASFTEAALADFTVTSSNAKVLTAEKVLEGGKYKVKIVPVSEGTAIITVTLTGDPLKRKVTRTIKVVGDQMKGMNIEFEPSSDLATYTSHVAKDFTSASDTATAPLTLRDADLRAPLKNETNYYVIKNINILSMDAENQDQYAGVTTSINWTSTDSKVAKVTVVNGEARLYVLGAGHTQITGKLSKVVQNGKTITPGAAISVNINIEVKKMQPTFETTAITVYRQSSTGTELKVIMPEGIKVADWSQVELVDPQFHTKVSGIGFKQNEDGTVYITANKKNGNDYVAELVKAGNYVISGELKSSGDDFINATYDENGAEKPVRMEQPVTLTVADKAVPKATDLAITVPPVDYYYYLDEQQPITISLKNGFELESLTYVADSNIDVTKSEDGVYRIKLQNDVYDNIKKINKNITFNVKCKDFPDVTLTKTVTLKFTDSIVTPKLDKNKVTLDNAKPGIYEGEKITLIIPVSGETTSPKADLLPLGSGDDTSTLIPADDNTAKMMNGSTTDKTRNAVSDGEGDYLRFTLASNEDNNGNILSVTTTSLTKKGTYNFTLTAKAAIGEMNTGNPAEPEGETVYKDMKPVKITVVVNDTKPKAGLSVKSVKVNNYYPSIAAASNLTFTEDVELEDCDITLKSAPANAQGQSLDDNLKVKETQNQIVVQPRYGATPGTYTLTITPTVIVGKTIDSGGTELTLEPVDLTVVVEAKMPTVKLSQSTLKIDSSAAIQGTYPIGYNVTGAYDEFKAPAVYRDAKTADPITSWLPTEPVLEGCGNEGLVVHVNQNTLGGTYKYYVAPKADLDVSEDDVTELPRMLLTITVDGSKKAKVTTKTSTLILNNQYESVQSGDILFTTNDSSVKLSDYLVEGTDALTKEAISNGTITAAAIADGSGVHFTVNKDIPIKTYKFTVYPKADTTINGIVYSKTKGNALALEPVKVSVKVVSKAPTLKLDAATAMIYADFRNTVTLGMTDVDGAIDASKTDNTQTYYLNRSTVNGKTSYALQQVTEGVTKTSACYAEVISMPNGDISVIPEARVQYLASDITLKNQTITRTLSLKNGNDFSNTQKINITIKAKGVNPTSQLNKTSLTFNNNFDLAETNLTDVQNVLKLSTSATGNGNAYITKYDVAIAAPKNGAGLLKLAVCDAEGADADFSGDKDELYFRLLPLGKPVKGKYVFTITPYISDVKATDADYISSDCRKLNSIKITVNITDTLPAISFSSLKATMNANCLEPLENVITMTSSMGNMEDPIITATGKNAGPVLLIAQEQENGTYTLSVINDSWDTPKGNYTFTVTPCVSNDDGEVFELTKAKKTITVSVNNNLPKAALQSATLNINVTTSPDAQPSAKTKVVYSGELAAQIQSASYDCTLTSKPKGASDTDVELNFAASASATELSGLLDTVVATCVDSGIPAGNYVFTLIPHVTGDSLADDITLPKLKLTVKVNKSEPKAKLSTASITLNSNFAQLNDTTKLTLSSDVQEITGVKAELTAYPTKKVKKNTWSKEMEVVDTKLDVIAWSEIGPQDNDRNSITINTTASVNAMPGTYKFKLTPQVELQNGNAVELVPVTYTVKVVATLPTVTLSTTSLNLNKLYPNEANDCDDSYEEVDADTVGILPIAIKNAPGSLEWSETKTLNTLVCTNRKAAEKEMAEEILDIRLDRARAVGCYISIANYEDLPNGTYSFKFTPTMVVEDTGMEIELKPLTFSLVITDKPLTMKIKQTGKIDLANRDTTAVNIVPAISDSKLDRLSYDDNLDASYFRLEGVNDGKTPDYSGLFDFSIGADQKSIDIYAKPGKEINTKTSYTFNLVCETYKGEEIAAKIAIRPTQTTPTIKADTANVTLYKSAADAQMPVVKLTSTGKTAPMFDVLTTNPDFEASKLTLENGVMSVGIKLKAEAKASYAAGSTVKVPLIVSLEGGTEAKVIPIKVKIQN